jgi:hypothetical protein
LRISRHLRCRAAKNVLAIAARKSYIRGEFSGVRFTNPFIEGGSMHSQPLQIFKSSLVRIVVIVLGAVLILSALPDRVTAQQNNASASPASSAVPRIIQFNGTLDGIPSGTVSIMFTLYENEQGGTALWSETQNVQVDAQGHYTALLGSTSPEGLPLNLFTTVQAHWFAVQPLLQGFGEQPRVLLVSAPYALKAGDAETIGGLPPSAFVRTAASLGASGTTAGTGSAVLPNTVIGSGTTPAKPLPPVPYYNAGLGYKIGGNIVLALPGGGGSGNTALGIAALGANPTGINNTATGNLALASDTTGNDNTASGAFALEFNTNGNKNTATGESALLNNTTGASNTATGFEALHDNTTGMFNAANGESALLNNTTGSNNTATGGGALFNANASDNTASGHRALFSDTSGGSNTASGSSALYFNTTGNGNIAIGYNAATNVSGGNSNNIHIGSLGSSGDSGAVRIGCNSTALCPGGSGTEQTSFFAAGVRGVTTGQNNAVPVLIDSNGQLGTVSSSRRFKEDIHDMGGASEGLMRLRPVTFRYKQPFDDGSKPIQYGLIAEEVAEVYPDLVARSTDGQIETVKYQVLDPMLLNEVQRQQAEIQALQKQLNEFRGLQERLDRMEAALATISHGAGIQ